MKRIILNLALAATISGAGVLTSCNEKPKTVEKTATKPETKTEDTVVTAPADTTSTEKDTTSVTETTTETASAGAQKFGHINSADLVDIMPEKKKADASLEAFVRSLESKLGSMQNDYRRKVAEFQNQERNMVDAIKETKIKDIQTLEMQMQQSQAEGQEKIAKKREALYKQFWTAPKKQLKKWAKKTATITFSIPTRARLFIPKKATTSCRWLRKNWA